MPIKSQIKEGEKYFESQNWQVYPFQRKTWQSYLEGRSGIINAPTGSGKTYSLFIPIALEALNNNDQTTGLQAIWLTPIRALTKEIQQSCLKASRGLGLDWNIEIRTGDTKTSQRQSQLKSPPQMLITTPESLHVLFCSKENSRFFGNLQTIVVDEWHELMGSKRGVQTELAISRFRGLNPKLKIWGISATINNLSEAQEVLLGKQRSKQAILIRSKQKKIISIESIIPDKIENYPWAGHLGIKLLDKILPIIDKSKTTLLFTNTRAQCEIWYHKILDTRPDLAGIMAMHHGSIGRELRDWVEDSLHEEKLKLVVCTSSLDLGVDFRPVETIIQVGSPKGVSRFVQRAGRSGHQPGAISRIYFVPTHALELVEGAALRTAIVTGIQEPRMPYIRCFDVLIQYLMSLAVGEGFSSTKIFKEIKKTHCFASITPKDWEWVMNFIVYGSQSLSAYDEYQKVIKRGHRYVVEDRKIAQRHRLSIGTIVSETALLIKFVSGKRLGTIEEWFIAQLTPGDVFWFSGRPLELVKVKDMTAIVRPTKKRTGKIPSWQGGRMPLSTMLSKTVRQKLYNYAVGIIDEMELDVLYPLLEQQRADSYLPSENEFLIEYIHSDEGYHLLMYPFEGRFVHEGMAALIAQRISSQLPITFSIAMNDYGFELLSDKEIDVEKLITQDLFSTSRLWEDIQSSMNSVEMARRKFRDIAKISGLIFQGFPGNQKKDRHLQSSSSLLFDVFRDYEPDNLLFLQTYEEVLTFQLEEARLREALKRIKCQKLIISRPKKFSPFSFPLIVDGMREKVTSEKLEDRIQKMLAANVRD